MAHNYFQTDCTQLLNKALNALFTNTPATANQSIVFVVVVESWVQRTFLSFFFFTSVCCL